MLCVSAGWVGMASRVRRLVRWDGCMFRTGEMAQTHAPLKRQRYTGGMATVKRPEAWELRLDSVEEHCG